MKKYVSTKQVDAEPMTVGDAYRCNLIKTDIYKNLEKDSLGFYIIDEDGYESWLPAELFYNAYKLAETERDRLNKKYYYN